MTEYRADPNHSFPYNLLMHNDAKIGDVLNFDKGCLKVDRKGFKYIRVNPKKNDGKRWKLIE